jgi:CheY-like chemotaxis protein
LHAIFTLEKNHYLLKGINILVVEDNLLNQKIVGFILKKQGAVITMAMNGRDAIDMLLKVPFDIVLMDLQMPEMDGFTAIERIRKEMKSDVPIIALTAGLLVEEIAQCEQIGANGCMSKPIDPTGLCEMVAKLTKEHRKLSKNNVE